MSPGHNSGDNATLKLNSVALKPLYGGGASLD